MAATCTGVSSGKKIFCTAGTAWSPSGIAMPKAEKSAPEPLRASTSFTCSCSMYFPEGSEVQGLMVFFIHAARNSFACCNWYCTSRPGTALFATGIHDRQSSALPAEPPCRSSRQGSLAQGAFRPYCASRKIRGPCLWNSHWSLLLSSVGLSHDRTVVPKKASNHLKKEQCIEIICSKEHPATTSSPETTQIPDPSASALKSSFL